jgi:AcrR family transcriptional regulator
MRAEAMARVADETRFEAQLHRILKAAATCFNQKGFSGTSLKDVSRHLGLTLSVLFACS